MMDVISRLVAFLLFVSLSPVWLLALFWVFVWDRKNPVYTSKRVGKHKKIFSMVKIRTMSLSGHEDPYTLDHHPRVTLPGKVLRLLKVDELLQLWNIVRGDMRFFGPRPDIISALPLYGGVEKIFDVLPGMMDISSLVFSREGKLLSLSKTSGDAFSYEAIFAVKKNLMCFYVDHASWAMNAFLLYLLGLRFLSSRLFICGLETFFSVFRVPPPLAKTSLSYVRV